jgi:hypothetical protein
MAVAVSSRATLPRRTISARTSAVNSPVANLAVQRVDFHRDYQWKFPLASDLFDPHWEFLVMKAVQHLSGFWRHGSRNYAATPFFCEIISSRLSIAASPVRLIDESLAAVTAN